MARITAPVAPKAWDVAMPPARIAIVGRDPDLRLRAAEIFDSAPPEWAVAVFDEVPAGADAVVVCPDVEVPGIPLDIEDPTSTLDGVRRALTSHEEGRTFVVTAASGGSGVTTVAMHLAALMGKRDRACYVELSARAGGRERLGWSDEIADRSTALDEGSLLDAAIPAPGGFRALLAPSDGARRAAKDVIALCRATFSFVVVDAGPDPGCSSLLLEATAAIAVVPPSVPGARRTASLLAGHPDARWAVVVNRTGPGSRLTNAAFRSLLGCRPAIELPCNPRLRDAEDTGTFLLDRWSRWTQKVDALAGTLAHR